MPDNYDYREYAEGPFTARFSVYGNWVWGMEGWQRLVSDPTLRALNAIREEGIKKMRQTPQICPRLFVSHRQSDTKYALHIAKIATDEGFQFWLDILDPYLQSLNTKTYTPDEVTLLAAGIIEIGLINSTHVLAVITHQTQGTMWVPYEYGRITAIPTLTGRACAWIHPNQSFYLPEYLLLGQQTHNESEIRKWLKNEMKTWSPHTPCSGSWNNGPTTPLP